MTRRAGKSNPGGRSAAAGSRSGLWYADGLRFECRRCGQCCGGEPGYIWIAPEELRKAAEKLGMHVLDFCSMYVAEYDRGLSLREQEGGDCCMLRDGKCLIYADRPLQCRTWPWWPSNLRSRRAWELVARRCPGIGRGRLWTAEEIIRERNRMEI